MSNPDNELAVKYAKQIIDLHDAGRLDLLTAYQVLLKLEDERKDEIRKRCEGTGEDEEVTGCNGGEE